MNTATLQARFTRMGARLKLGELSGRDGRAAGRPLTLDIRSDADGEYFDVRLRSTGWVELEVVDVRRRDQHLLLRAREQRGEHHFLCGHDEQHWFVAALP